MVILFYQHPYILDQILENVYHFLLVLEIEHHILFSKITLDLLHIFQLQYYVTISKTHAQLATTITGTAPILAADRDPIAGTLGSNLTSPPGAPSVLRYQATQVALATGVVEATGGGSRSSGSIASAAGGEAGAGRGVAGVNDAGSSHCASSRVS